MTSIVKQVNVYAIVRDSGTPLYKASIWIGEAGEDPEYSPKRVWFVQEEGQQFEGKQPIITGVGGFPFFEGDKVAIKVEGDFSIRIRDFSGAVTYESLSGNNVTFDDGEAVPLIADLLELPTNNYEGDEVFFVAETAANQADGFHVIFRVGDQSASVAAAPDFWLVPDDRAGDGSEGAYQKVLNHLARDSANINYTPDGNTVETAIGERAKTADLAATTGATLVGYDGESANVKLALDARDPTVATLGELPAALLNVAVGKAVDVLGRTATGDGYQGRFFRSSTDYSAEVAVDTQQAIYIDLGDGTYGVRSFGQAVDSRPIKRAGWFGYVGDGVADDTAALQALTADGNCEMEIPFTGTQGALVSGTITLKSNTKLKFLSGARWVQNPSMGSNPVLATAEGSGNDLSPPVTAQTNITIENPYITMNGATARAIRASAGGHDIHIWNPIIRSGDNASGQIGILSYNCFNVNVYNPSIVLGGDDAACYSCRNFKFKAGGVTPETGYSVMTNNVIRSGTLKVTGMNSWAIQLWLLNEVGDVNTGGASGDCFVVDNVALLSDDSADLNTAIDIRGPVTGVEIRAPHIEDFWKVLKTGNSGVKGTITGAKPQSCATIFEFGSSGTLFTAPDFGVFLAGGASPSTLVAGGSLGTLILTANRLASADINAVSNANMIIRNMRDNERNLTTQTTLTLQNVIDDNAIVTHTNSATALTVTLPANSPIGQEHTISKNASGGLTLNADAGDRILFGGVTNALGASISSSTAPSTIKIKKSAQGWIVQGATGTWT